MTTSRNRQRVVTAAVGIGALVVALVGAQLVVLLVAGRPPAGTWVWWPAIAAAALAAVAFEPLRRWAMRLVARTRRSGRRSPEAVVAGFGDRVSRGVPIDDLLVELAEALRRDFAAGRAEIWTAEGTSLERVVTVPDAPIISTELPPSELTALSRVGTAGDAWLALWAPTLASRRADAATAGDAALAPSDGVVRVAPARHGGAVLGAIVLERDAGADSFGAREDRALGELGRRLGDILRNRQLDTALRRTLDDLQIANAELRASRARLVATADAERRRLERDLHDGAQQHLVALSLHLDLARDTVASDPAGTVELLARLAGDVRQTIEQLRTLAHGIYPPLLMDLGLDGALRAVARRSPQRVTVDAADVGRASAEIEATIYFCCLEALQNAAKHATSAAVRITVTTDADAVRFEVADDGPGFDPVTAPAGHGLQNMADRVGAVGGRIAVDAAPGRGTRVVGTVPR